MTCADARHLILTADPVALRERRDPVLRAHLEQCTECSAAAGHVVADLSRLRAALMARGASRVVPIARPRRSVKRVAMTVVPIALAAELAFFAFLGSQDTVNPLIDRVVIDDSVLTVRPVLQTEIDTGEVVAASAPAARLVSVQPVLAKDTTVDGDTTAAARPDTAAPPAHLRVHPEPRQQTAVITTSNPKITVVWITKGDSL